MNTTYNKEIRTERCCFNFVRSSNFSDNFLIEAVHHNFPYSFELCTSWEAIEIEDQIFIFVEHLPVLMTPAELDDRLDELYRVGDAAVEHMQTHYGIALEFEFAEIDVECCHAWKAELDP